MRAYRHETRSLGIAIVLLVNSFFQVSSFSSPYRQVRRYGPLSTIAIQQIQWNRAFESSQLKRSHTTAIYAIVSSLTTVPSTSTVGYLYMFLLAMQFASQPLLTQKFASKTIVRSTYVLAQELVRLVVATALLVSTGSWTCATMGWSWRLCLTTVGIPAFLYILQNKLSLTAYQHLSPMTYNVLNQTKTLSAAVCCFVLLGQRQSQGQMGALVLLFLSVFVMELDFSTNSSNGQVEDERIAANPSQVRIAIRKHRDYYILGVIPVLSASAISGLAGAFAQRTLQTRNALLFSVELACISIVYLTLELVFRPRISSSPSSLEQQQSWTRGWTISTWIPVATNAVGGILVGLVTKHAGAVQKGFSLLLGMVLSGVLQNQLQDKQQKRVTFQQWMGGFLAGASLWLHSRSSIVQ